MTELQCSGVRGEDFLYLFKAAPAGPLGRTLLIPSGRVFTAPSPCRSGKRAGPGLAATHPRPATGGRA